MKEPSEPISLSEFAREYTRRTDAPLYLRAKHNGRRYRLTPLFELESRGAEQTIFGYGESAEDAALYLLDAIDSWGAAPDYFPIELRHFPNGETEQVRILPAGPKCTQCGHHACPYCETSCDGDTDPGDCCDVCEYPEPEHTHWLETIESWKAGMATSTRCDCCPLPADDDEPDESNPEQIATECPPDCPCGFCRK